MRFIVLAILSFIIINLLTYTNTFKSGSVYNKTFLYDSSGFRHKSFSLNTSGDIIGYSEYKYKNGLLDTVISFNIDGTRDNIRVFTFEQKESSYNIFESGVW